MRAGRMDRIISLYQESNTTNDFGEQITTWIPLCMVGAEKATGTLTIGTLYQITATETNHFYTGCTVGDVWTAAVATELDADNKVKPVIRSYQEWAERLELRGDERWSAQQTIAKIACKYRIRYRSDITPMIRVVDADGREYDIQAQLELGRKEGIELIVSARGE